MKIAVFCGSSAGNNPKFMDAAKALGKHRSVSSLDHVTLNRYQSLTRLEEI